VPPKNATPRQTVSRRNSRSRIETVSNVGRDRFESPTPGLQPPADGRNPSARYRRSSCSATTRKARVAPTMTSAARSATNRSRPSTASVGPRSSVPARAGHQGQQPHDHDGQEQSPDRRYNHRLDRPKHLCALGGVSRRRGFTYIAVWHAQRVRDLILAVSRMPVFRPESLTGTAVAEN
jgi:hypothetical protein